MKLLCTIDRVLDLQYVWQTDRPKRSVLVTEHWRDPANSMMIDFLGQKVQLLDNLQEWSVVEIEYTIKYSEHNGRVYNNIKGHAITDILTS